MTLLQSEPIDFAALTESVRNFQCGAVCLFLGTVRDMTKGVRTCALTYQAHDSLAAQLLQQVENETRSRWPVQNISIVHRLGHLRLGEISVAVAVGCPHRHDAFQACQYAIDRLKAIVPIWKQEHYLDGNPQWIHPQKDQKEYPPQGEPRSPL